MSDSSESEFESSVRDVITIPDSPVKLLVFLLSTGEQDNEVTRENFDSIIVQPGTPFLPLLCSPSSLCVSLSFLPLPLSHSDTFQSLDAERPAKSKVKRELFGTGGKLYTCSMKVIYYLCQLRIVVWSHFGFYQCGEGVNGQWLWSVYFSYTIRQRLLVYIVA